MKNKLGKSKQTWNVADRKWPRRDPTWPPDEMWSNMAARSDVISYGFLINIFKANQNQKVRTETRRPQDWRQRPLGLKAMDRQTKTRDQQD